MMWKKRGDRRRIGEAALVADRGALVDWDDYRCSVDVGTGGVGRGSEFRAKCG